MIQGDMLFLWEKHQITRVNSILGLAALVVLYVEAINTPDAIPNVQRAWDTFVLAKCLDVKKAALQTYDAHMKSQLSNVLPCSNTEIRTSHEAALKECESQFIMELAGISTNTIEMASRELKVRHKTMIRVFEIKKTFFALYSQPRFWDW